MKPTYHIAPNYRISETVNPVQLNSTLTNISWDGNLFTYRGWIHLRRFNINLSVIVFNGRFNLRAINQSTDLCDC